MLADFREPIEQLAIAIACEGRAQLGRGRAMALVQGLEEGPKVSEQFTGRLTEPVAQYIGVADGGETSSEPLELLLERPAPVALEQVAIQPQLAPKPPCRSAHPVNAFDLAPLRPEVVFAQPLEPLGQCETDRTGCRCIRADSLQGLRLKSFGSHRSLSVVGGYGINRHGFRLSAGAMNHAWLVILGGIELNRPRPR
jgi:hypothetical protein